MVIGIDRWKEFFKDYKDKYVLIGGAACNLLEEEFDMQIPDSEAEKISTVNDVVEYIKNNQ